MIGTGALKQVVETLAAILTLISPTAVFGLGLVCLRYITTPDPTKKALSSSHAFHIFALTAVMSSIGAITLWLAKYFLFEPNAYINILNL